MLTSGDMVGRESNGRNGRADSSAKRASAAAGRLGVRIVEHETFANEVRVVVEHRSVEIQKTLLVDKNLGAFRPFVDLVAETRFLLPREGVTQPRASAALDPDAQTAILNALLGHQAADLACGSFRNLNHFS